MSRRSASVEPALSILLDTILIGPGSDFSGALLFPVRRLIRSICSCSANLSTSSENQFFRWTFAKLWIK